ncbi:YgiW/YdeI family stress tolerance OB fold protein [Photobacterium ganghwense]|uniref:YgiW/YdeI family stress tolerance OB fold protein n=2 Tax=Photobacterium TaxID=657 RepID=UPI0039EFCFE5
MMKPRIALIRLIQNKRLLSKWFLNQQLLNQQFLKKRFLKKMMSSVMTKRGMTKSAILAIATTLTLGPAIALATPTKMTYTGPVDVTPIKDVMHNSGMLKDHAVVLEGFLVKQISADTYMLSDGVDEVKVELDDDIRFNKAITPETRLRLYGEVEGGLTPEVEIDKVEFL